ncbi:MAG: D-alanyl-D-alanine carboxypeptidase, partial [Phyllobacteriaceae bacterium]|nr:D-alanyl-D-alanine carboxypeptidase [Phyllobacteriaceae bacterium]
RTGGAPSHTTTMFAPVNVPAKVGDLFRGVMIQSANDGSIALAEGIAGGESGFAELMNKRAADWGMTASRFGNPSGLPNADNRSTAHDLLVVARHLVRDYPDVYRIYSEREFTYNKIRQLNRNPMVDPALGGDGIAVGSSKEGGAVLVGSAVQNGQRLLVAIAGAANDKERNEDARKLVEWGFRSFETVRIYKAGEVIGPATVFGGAATTVPLVSANDIDILVPRGSRDKLKARIVYTGPVKAPIKKGQPIGRLWVTNDEKPVVDYPVEAGDDVAVGTLGRRAVDGTRELLIGLLRP